MKEAELRDRTRALLKSCHPDEAFVDCATFRGAQFDQGLAWVHRPQGLGGLGIDAGLQTVVNDELQRGASTFYHDMHVNPLGIGMGAPVLFAHGSEAQKRELLRPLFTGEEIWCQLFSEPSAGSDLAAMSSRAVRSGEHWIVSGQKVWTTLAHQARRGMLLCRTDPSAPKHRGLSYFILDMQSPGVEVRPLYQITAEAEFNEVFMTDVRVPHASLVGEEGRGWEVGMTTLMNERVMIGSGAPRAGGGPIATLIDLCKRTRDTRSAQEQAVIADRVAQLYIRAELLRLTGQRSNATRRAGGPGPEGSVGKLARAETHKAIWECCLDVLGAEGLVYEPGYELRRGAGRPADPTLAAKYSYLRAQAHSIEGGTSDVMRNILGERVLGLPREPRIDADVPWNQVPRSPS